MAEFRERLCEVATGLFAERGSEGFSMRELATALGVSPMTPYRYFRDKDDMLAAVRARAFDRFAAVLEQAFAKPGSAVERAAAVGDAYVKFAFGEPQSYRMMFDLSQPGEEKYPDLMRATARARATMTQHIPGLIEQGLLEGNPDEIGHVFWATIHGAVVLQLAGKLTREFDFDRILDAATRALVEGFQPKRIS
ncbi:MAG: TetR/AcrR family transcriptional regulator [Rhizomicrobium sp.]